MAPKTVSVGIVGAGRVGAALGAALHSHSRYDVTAASGESDASRTRIATLLPHLTPSKPSAVARSCDVLIVSVPDDMLGNVITVLADSGALRAGQVVAHTSGRHGVAVLEPARRIGADVAAVHPAMTFTGTALDLPRLGGCAFGVTAETEQARAQAQALVEALRGELVWVPEAMRTTYHAALAHGANHLVTLVSESLDLLRTCGAEDPAAILRPLLEAALDNALSFGDAALTGPIVRGDVETVRDHLRKLREHNPAALPSYVAMAESTVRRAEAQGRLESRRAAQLREVLASARGTVQA